MAKALSVPILQPTASILSLSMVPADDQGREVLFLEGVARANPMCTQTRFIHVGLCGDDIGRVPVSFSRSLPAVGGVKQAAIPLHLTPQTPSMDKYHTPQTPRPTSPSLLTVVWLTLTWPLQVQQPPPEHGCQRYSCGSPATNGCLPPYPSRESAHNSLTHLHLHLHRTLCLRYTTTQAELQKVELLPNYMDFTPPCATGLDSWTTRVPVT